MIWDDMTAYGLWRLKAPTALSHPALGRQAEVHKPSSTVCSLAELLSAVLLSWRSLAPGLDQPATHTSRRGQAANRNPAPTGALAQVAVACSLEKAGKKDEG